MTTMATPRMVMSETPRRTIRLRTVYRIGTIITGFGRDSLLRYRRWDYLTCVCDRFGADRAFTKHAEISIRQVYVIAKFGFRHQRAMQLRQPIEGHTRIEVVLDVVVD